jgi:hypothetical protein
MLLQVEATAFDKSTMRFAPIDDVKSSYVPTQDYHVNTYVGAQR